MHSTATVPFWWMSKVKERDGASRSDELTDQVPADQLRQLATGEANLVGATLTVLRGQGVGKVFWLKPGANVLGRSDQVVVPIQMTGVSRQHAQIIESGGVYVLEDLGSTNGTFVRGQLVTDRIELRSGDQINLGGHALLRFALEVGGDDSQRTHLYEVATRDRLTAALSRRMLEEQLAGEWVWTRRPTRICGIALIDIDDLSGVNSLHGSQAGDYVLREFVKRVGEVCGPEHSLARVVGGTFALFFRALGRADAAAAAELVREHVSAKPLDWYGTPLVLHVSLGVASSEEPQVNGPDALITLAESRLQAAKQQGKNRVNAGGPA